ncbi:MAG: hypothetical protein KDA05_02350, partial [Phycisphaerales bacterium]|nr:hypothetical protein [Phycisphaerales bacterium]
RRVLKPGGTLILTAPLFFQENEPPHDYYRFTQHGLRHLLNAAGFDVERLEWLEGYAGTVAYQIGMAVRSLPRSPSRLGGGAWGALASAAWCASLPALMMLRWVLARSDVKARITDRGMCKNYAVVARARSASGVAAAA